VVLGIDPGTHRTGYAVAEGVTGRPVAREFGVITTPASMATGTRLRTIYERVRALIERYEPEVAAVERLFLGQNAPSAVSVGQARGVVLLALAQAGVTLEEFTPSAVKTAIVGYGRAEKAQVQEMVRRVYRLEQQPRPDDAADALALAMCALGSQSVPPALRGGARR
jgi:crossover junction endodeoxyribonuclease RuvC